MKKQSITLLLTILMSMMGIQAFAHDIEVANADGVTIYYTYINNNTELAVSYQGNSYSSYSNEYTGNVVIPESVTYNGTTYSVTSIGSFAFYGCTSLTSITIPNSVTKIGVRAFRNCITLNNFIIPNSVNSIEEYAFQNCYTLSRIVIPNTITNISEGVFSYCNNLTSVTIPNSVTTIGVDVFEYCSSLMSISIPNSVTSIGDGSFQNCSSLANINIPNSVTNIGQKAFSGCKELSSVTISNCVTSIGESAFEGCSGLTSLKVEDGNTVYDSRNNCNAIIKTAKDELILGCKNTIIPNSVKAIGNSAFSGCKGLTNITIPNSVKAIGNSAFYYCEALTSIAIPNSVTSIGAYAFGDCYSLTNVTIPNSVVKIENGTFDWCENLTSITIPDSVTSIGDYAFYASGLTNVKIPNSVYSIGLYAFYQCKNLKIVILGNSVSNIDKWAFGVTPLTDVYCNAETVPTKATNSFNNTFNTSSVSNATLHIPATSINDYKIIAPWSEFKEIVEIPATTDANIEFVDTKVKSICVANWDFNCDGELSYAEAEAVTSIETIFKNNTEITNFNELQYFTGITSIEQQAFEDCSNLISVTIPNNVTEIGFAAFQSCGELISVSIPNSVTSIGGAAFNRCSKLISATIPNSVTSIDSDAFGECTSLTSVTIPSSVKNIAYGVFSACTGLTSIIVESGNTVYDSRNNCNAIIETSTNTLIQGCKNSVIPNSVSSIGVRAFDSCYDLVSVNIPNSVTNIGGSAFRWCNSLISITIPKSVISIGENAFWGCTGLISIIIENGNPSYDSRDNCNAIIESSSNTLIQGCDNTVIPNSVTSIGRAAFFGLYKMTSITIPNSVTSIGSSSFAYCYAITSIKIPNSVISIGAQAFQGCPNLTSVTIPSSVTSIGIRAFYCDNLVRLTIDNPTPVNFNSSAFPNRGNTTLYVPIGSKAAYEDAAYWEGFKEIMEMDLEPLEGDDNVDFSDEDSSINEETNLTGTIVNNMYYNIGTDAGGFSAEDGCIVITKETSDEQMEALEGLGITDEEMKQNFTGIIFKVPAGKGKVAVTAETTGNMTLKVKVGNSEPMEMELSGKLKMKVPYNVSEETMVYIFAGTTDENGARGMLPIVSEQSLKIYGIELETEVVKGDANGDKKVNALDVDCLRNYILGLDPQPFSFESANLNGDSVVDIVDLTLLIEMLK